MNHRTFFRRCGVLTLCGVIGVSASLPPGHIVVVTPDGTSVSQPANLGPFVAYFTVSNTGTYTDSYNIWCAGRVNITCAGVDITYLTLDPGESGAPEATYYTGTPGIGRVVVGATGDGNPAADSGYYKVTVQSVGAPVISLRNHNGDHRDRSLCLTSGAGQAAAWQCGDLLVSHGLPGYTTMGRSRSLALIYNSAQAVPRPVVAAAVNQSGLGPPQSVKVVLAVGGAPTDSATYNPWSSGAMTRQVVIPHDASTDASGIYPFTLTVRNQYPGVYETSLADTLIVVNRAASPFGTGWSLAGVEELRTGQPGNKILWVGGDGSAKVYRNLTATTWASAAGGFRDTLVRFDSASVIWYRRTLRRGVQVTYDSAGRHVQTRNRVGQVTTFTWTGSPIRLTSIQVPPGGAGTTYTLTYTSDGSRMLDRIQDPAGRVLDATIAGGRLTQLIDPDTTAFYTSFAYDGAGRMTGRTNRRGFTTKYVYANNLRVTRDSVRLDSATVTYAVTTFKAWDEKGVAPTNGATGLIAVDTAQAYTMIDGPRPNVGDSVRFWVDRWGAQVKVIDPAGATTLLARGNAAVPALVTRIQYPNGRIMGSGYNARGNVLYVADSTYEGTTWSAQTVTTSFVYDDTLAFPDSPTRISTPAETTLIAYHDSLGLPDTITAPGGHRTVFTYFLSPTSRRGRVSQVKELGVSVVDTTTWLKQNKNLTTSFLYDGWGNDSVVTSPRGAQTRYEYDAYRRVARAFDPQNHWTRYLYDLLNQPRATFFRDTLTIPDSIATEFFYNRTGMVTSTDGPKGASFYGSGSSDGALLSWEFDAAERPVRSKDEAQATTHQYFGPSGLLDSLRTGLDHVIRYSYDASGRRTSTTYPARLNNFWGTVYDYTVPGDSFRVSYDAMGRPLTVIHRVDTITYVYNKEGSVRSERQAVNGSPVTMVYWYDAAGRRTKMFNGTDTLRYSYGLDGLLSRLRVEWGTGQPADSFLFYWDARGRRDSLVYSNQTYVSFGYDSSGFLRMVCSRHSPNVYDDDYLEQRYRYTRLDADGQPLVRHRYLGGTNSPDCGSIPTGSTNEFTSWSYDARHQVRSDVVSYTYDKAGNRVGRYLLGSVLQDSLFYRSYPGGRIGNRIHGKVVPGPSTRWYSYDSAGARTEEWHIGAGPNCTGNHCEDRLYYYNSLGQLTGVRTFDASGQWVGHADRCRYDPLGRRVRDCNANGGLEVSYDGNNPVRVGTSFNWRFVHGPMIDDPLVGIMQSGQQPHRKYYYLTDGGGRLLAFTDSVGTNLLTSDPTYGVNGGYQAGAIDRSTGFDNTRAENSELKGLSYYRNRYYDQATGSFTGEDPIGIAGGMNLYQYAGNNPVVHTDPFGLKVCFARGRRQDLVQATEEATGSRITLDQAGCIDSITSTNTSSQYKELRDRLEALNQELDTYTVAFSGMSSRYEPWARTARISTETPFWYHTTGPTGRCDDFAADNGYAGAVAHELLGHGYGHSLDGFKYLGYLLGGRERAAMKSENLYFRASGSPERCRY